MIPILYNISLGSNNWSSRMLSCLLGYHLLILTIGSQSCLITVPISLVFQCNSCYLYKYKKRHVIELKKKILLTKLQNWKVDCMIALHIYPFAFVRAFVMVRNIWHFPGFLNDFDIFLARKIFWTTFVITCSSYFSRIVPIVYHF